MPKSAAAAEAAAGTEDPVQLDPTRVRVAREKQEKWNISSKYISTKLAGNDAGDQCK